MELRCLSKKFGELTQPSNDEGHLSVMCPSRWCGRRENVTVLHVFSTSTGELLSTRQFRTPPGRV